jgi:outer membrane lipoprotein-sorting protein
MMRTKFLTILLAGLVSASPVFSADFGAEDQEALARISDYLNGIESAQGQFVQIGPDGSNDQGTFYLRKPGRVRFEYAEPNPNLIVADGATIAIENSELETVDRYPLTDSPLRILLNDNVDLANDPRISEVRREAGAISITARQEEGLTPGEITLQFLDNGANLELRQWEVLDAQGLRTIVAVTNLREGISLAPALFIIEDENPFGRREF